MGVIVEKEKKVHILDSKTLVMNGRLFLRCCSILNFACNYRPKLMVVRGNELMPWIKYYFIMEEGSRQLLIFFMHMFNLNNLLFLSLSLLFFWFLYLFFFFLIDITGVIGGYSHNIDELASTGHILFSSCGIMDEIVRTQAFWCKSCNGIWHIKWHIHWAFES